MQIDFRKRLTLVTGGTRGIGAAVVQQLVDSGARVIATGKSAEVIGRLQAGANRSEHPIRYERVDFSDDHDAESFASRMAAEPVDVLINNAGINKIALTGEVDLADWDRIQRVNVRAALLLSRALAPKMAKRGYGRIVNITSIFGHVSRQMRVSYSTSKFALLGLTKALALDYAEHNVLVNALAPGFIDTELTRSLLTEEQLTECVRSTPVGRLGSPEEIARAVVFLASEANSFMTGQHMIVDGGFTSA